MISEISTIILICIINKRQFTENIQMSIVLTLLVHDLHNAYRGNKKDAINAPLPFELCNDCPVQTWLFPFIFTFFQMGIPGSTRMQQTGKKRIKYL